MILSILICSLDRRKKLLDRLMSVLKPQLTKDVEVLMDIDKGIKKIGKKRNDLLKKAKGTYCCFIDDDDLVSDDYVSKILNAIKSNNPDCCSIEGIMTINNRNPRTFIHSIKYDHWFEKNRQFLRPPNHLNVIRTKYALMVGFPNVNRYEDRWFSQRIRKFLRKEAYIKGPIYYYLFQTRK